jgi:hypothetical protein
MSFGGNSNIFDHIYNFDKQIEKKPEVNGRQLIETILKQPEIVTFFIF